MVNGELILFILWTNTTTREMHVARLTRRPGRGLQEAIFKTRPNARPGWVITRVAGWNVPEHLRGPVAPDLYVALPSRPADRPLVPDIVGRILMPDGGSWRSPSADRRVVTGS